MHESTLGASRFETQPSTHSHKSTELDEGTPYMAVPVSASCVVDAPKTFALVTHGPVLGLAAVSMPLPHRV